VIVPTRSIPANEPNPPGRGPDVNYQHSITTTTPPTRSRARRDAPNHHSHPRADRSQPPGLWPTVPGHRNRPPRL